jgi:hypothetical protein
MKKAILSVLAATISLGALALILALTGCFSDWSGEGPKGTVTLRVGGGDSRTAVSGYPPKDNPGTPGPTNAPALADLNYKVFFNGSDLTDKGTTEPGSDVVKFSVNAGTYEIRVESYEPISGALVLYATGRASGVQVAAGQTKAVSITMSEAMTVTFVEENGTNVFHKMQTGKGDTITMPADHPVSSFSGTPGPGLYSGTPTTPEYPFSGWYKEASRTNKWDFSNDTVNGNITLYPKWETGIPFQNDIPGAISYINANPGTYTIVVGTNVNCPPNQTLDKSNINLTIIGVQGGGEQKISLSANGRLFHVGVASAPSDNTISLTLGENITLVGRNAAANGANNNQALVIVRYGASLTMLGNSKITGNTNTTTGTSANGGAVNLQDSSTFTMKDNAEIFGNSHTTTAGGGTGGGVGVISSSTFTMQDNAKVHSNSAGGNGGGVYVYTSTTAQKSNFIMKDYAEVSGNTAGGSNGGGVFVGSSNFTMQDNAKVSGNTAGTGGVYASGNTQLTMNNSASVSGNIGRGVSISGISPQTVVFTMSGNAQISDNTGDGVSNGGYATLNMQGGSITNNGGLGVSMINSNSVFNMTGGSITGNTDIGVRVGQYSVFTMDGNTALISATATSGSAVQTITTVNIKNGTITATDPGVHAVQIAYTGSGSDTNISGGTINATGTNASAVFIDTTDFQGGKGIFLSGTPVFNGAITLTASSGYASSITLENNYSQTGPTTIHLREYFNSTIANVISYWNGKEVLTGPGVDATRVGYFALGNFFTANNSQQQAIDPTHKIEDTGADIGKLVAK